MPPATSTNCRTSPCRKDMLKLAEHILESKIGDFEPATFADSYEEAVVAMLRTKQSGRAVSTSRAALQGREGLRPDGGPDALDRRHAKPGREAE